MVATRRRKWDSWQARSLYGLLVGLVIGLVVGALPADVPPEVELGSRGAERPKAPELRGHSPAVPGAASGQRLGSVQPMPSEEAVDRGARMRMLHAVYQRAGREDLYRKLVDAALVCPLGIWPNEISSESLLTYPFLMESIESIDRRMSGLNWRARLELSSLEYLFVGLRVGVHWHLAAGQPVNTAPMSVGRARSALQMNYGFEVAIESRIETAAGEWVEAVRTLRESAVVAMDASSVRDDVEDGRSEKAVGVFVSPTGTCAVVRIGDVVELDFILEELERLERKLQVDLRSVSRR